jgi:hypothetical protein
MGKPMAKLILVIFMIALGGCAATQQIKIKSQSERTDVFQEVPKDALPSAGFADLSIRASIKTHLKGAFPIEFGDTRHGEPDYPFIINVDGQAAIWKVDGQRETIRAESVKEMNPETGEGMRYILEKRIRLAPGMHRVFFSLPSEKVAMEMQVALVEGDANSLEFRPVYRSALRVSENFISGISRFKAYFNGQFIKPLRRGNGAGGEIIPAIAIPDRRSE